MMVIYRNRGKSYEILALVTCPVENKFYFTVFIHLLPVLLILPP